MPTPAQSYISAVNAYNSAARGESFTTKQSRDDVHHGEFADLVKSAIKEAVKIGERSEQLSIQGINDRADISKVVTAVNEAELTLQTVVAVRDKVLDAYKEIIRMPI
ncbi:MAG: flagellar hook-basal body complex protein FliE [Rhodospirillaceae bacterium]|jgi:flagellar hook-basal body complex protein FliE